MLRSFLFSVFLLPIFASGLTIGLGAGKAIASEATFFKTIQGKWSGPGEIVAGKYKGTKFTCVFDGASPAKIISMKIDGYCRVGMFSQPMNASVSKGRGKFSGTFLNGQLGEGMDITGGRYSRNKFVADIKRNDLYGAMVTRKLDNNRLQITISVRVSGKLIPVIGMALDRVKNPAKIARN